MVFEHNPGLFAKDYTGVNHMFISFIRTVILYIVINVVLRLMGKRQVGELEPSELVVAILISDLAAVPMQDIGIPLLSGVIPIVTLLAIELLLSELAMVSIKFRAFLSGKPVFIIQDGKIDQRAMEKNRLTIDELLSCLRINGILDVREVKYAILETGGQLTTFRYPEYEPKPACGNGNCAFSSVLISDGRLMEENLRCLGKDLCWLGEVLQKNGVHLSEVYLLTSDPEGEVYLVKKGEGE